MNVCAMGLCRERSENIIESVLSFLLCVKSEDVRSLGLLGKYFISVNILTIPEQFFSKFQIGTVLEGHLKI